MDFSSTRQNVNTFSENTTTFAQVANLSSGGSIGTAATTVDIYMGASVAQTTASQALTLPTPTGNCPKIFFVTNSGSASFTMYGTTIVSGATVGFLFSGVNVFQQGYVWGPLMAGASITTSTSSTSTTTTTTTP